MTGGVVVVPMDPLNGNREPDKLSSPDDDVMRRPLSGKCASVSQRPTALPNDGGVDGIFDGFYQHTGARSLHLRRREQSLDWRNYSPRQFSIPDPSKRRRSASSLLPGQSNPPSCRYEFSICRSHTWHAATCAAVVLVDTDVHSLFVLLSPEIHTCVAGRALVLIYESPNTPSNSEWAESRPPERV